MPIPRAGKQQVRPADKDGDRRTGGPQRLVQPAVEPEANTHEQQTGRLRTRQERGVSAGGRRRSLGYPDARRID